MRKTDFEVTDKSWYAIHVRSIRLIITLLSASLISFCILILSELHFKFLLAFISCLIILGLLVLVKDTLTFLLSGLIISLPFASADIFVGSIPTNFHAGGAQIVPELNVVDIFLVFILFYLLVNWRRDGFSIKSLPKLPTISFLCFIVWSALSIILSQHRLLGIVSLYELIKLFILWFVIILVVQKKNCGELCVKLLILGLFIQSIFAIYQYKFGFPFWLKSISQGDTTYIERLGDFNFLRVGGTIGWTTTFAQYLELLIPLSFCLFVVSKRFSTTIMIGICTLLSLLALIMTLSRMSWIAVSISICVAIIVIHRKRIIQSNIKLWIAIFCFVMVFLVFSPTIKERFVSYDGGSAAIRLRMYHVALQIIKENPLFGIGLNSYAEVMHSYDDKNMVTYVVFPVHNSFLLIAAEIGILGLIFLLIYLFSVLRALWHTIEISPLRSKAIAIGYMCGILGILLHSQVETGFKQEIQLWYVFSAVCALSMVLRTNSQTKLKL